MSYTLLTQFNSLLTVTPIYALDESVDFKSGQILSQFGDKFPPVQKPDGRGENYEIFINWYYLGEAGIGYTSMSASKHQCRGTPPCIEALMQTNQYINIDQ